MAWRISGTYIASCSCNLICPCPVDGPPTSPDGHCHGVGVFSIAGGNLDDTDLSGVNVGLVNLFPSNLTSGGWKLALTDEWLGMERGPVSFSGGDKPSGSIGDSSWTFEPLAGPPGSDSQTTVKNAAFGFAPEFRVGRAPGKMSALGLDFDAIYGETGDYEFASEMAEGTPKGRG